jgi:hypothetical protein
LLKLKLGVTWRRVVNNDGHMNQSLIRDQIVAALSHPEAEDGLYFNNLVVVHEEEERPIVEGEETAVLQALEDMRTEGLICVSGEGSQRIYALVTQ